MKYMVGQFMRLSALGVIGLVMVSLMAMGATPLAKATAVRPVVRHGWYNRATDLVRWSDYHWLTYRRGTKH